MAQQHQFGNRVSFQSNQRDKLQHYRLQIQKLQQQNRQQQEAYSKKIASLQQIIKQQQNGNYSNSRYSNSTNANYEQQNQTPYYQPSSMTHIQILKRDKQINRLSQENQKLRKQVNVNPDHQLLIKKRGFFDQIADKDAQIIRLKRTIYELQSKYDGKYYNDVRMKNQFTILQQQNKKLRKQLESYYVTSPKTDNIVNTQLLEGIRYKKQAQLLAKQNQLLKSQYKKVNDQYSTFIGSMQGKINSATQVDVLKRDLRESNKRNQQLMQYAKQLEGKNSALMTQIRPNASLQNYDQKNPQYRLSSHVDNSGNKKKHHRIFDQKIGEPTAFTDKKNINTTVYQQNTPQSYKDQRQLEQSKLNRQTATNQFNQQQRKHQLQMEEQQNRMREHQKFLDQKQKRMQQQQQKYTQLQNIESVENQREKFTNQNNNLNDSQNLPNTARKQGGYYDRFGLNRITSRVSGQSNNSK